MADYILHHGIWGFVLFVYAIMALVTLPIAIATLALEVKNYDSSCDPSNSVCVGKQFYVGLPYV